MTEPLTIAPPELGLVEPGNVITITATISPGELFYSMTNSFDGSVGVAVNTINDIEATMTMSSTEIAEDLGENLGMSVAWMLTEESFMGGTLAPVIVIILLGMLFVGLVKVILAIVSYLWRLIKFW